MADSNIAQDFELVLISYRDVKDQHPEWSDIAVEDYIARIRDLVRVANSVDINIDQVDLNTSDIEDSLQLISDLISDNGSLRSQIKKIKSEQERLILEQERLTLEQEDLFQLTAMAL